MSLDRRSIEKALENARVPAMHRNDAVKEIERIVRTEVTRAPMTPWLLPAWTLKKKPKK